MIIGLNGTILHDEILAANGSFDIQSIDQTFSHLLLYFGCRVDNAGSYISVSTYFNNDTTAANYNALRTEVANGGVVTGVDAANSVIGVHPGTGSPANAFSSFVMQILNYRSTDHIKVLTYFGGFQRVADYGVTNIGNVAWEDGGKTAINRIAIQAADDLLPGSYVMLIGIP